MIQSGGSLQTRGGQTKSDGKEHLLQDSLYAKFKNMQDHSGEVRIGTALGAGTFWSWVKGLLDSMDILLLDPSRATAVFSL